MNYRLTELKVLLFLLLLSAVSCQRPMYDEEDVKTESRKQIFL